MEEITTESQESKVDQVKNWLQDNLRIVVSILIVVAIAGGIYSYSKRGTTPVAEKDRTEEVAQIDEQSAQDESSSETEESTNSGIKSTETKSATQEKATPSSQETEGSFIETAGKGEGVTHLSRRALANYLEKNPDSSLSKEHKIYIEDYLRKNVKHQGGVKVGTNVEFSKQLISQAIEQSKKLNERQLQNLKQYSARVTTL